MQSAATRRASARTAAIAASLVGPYAITPGMDSMSAHQRPSSSCPRTMGIDSGETVSIGLASSGNIIATLTRAGPTEGHLNVDASVQQPPRRGLHPAPAPAGARFA